MSDNKIQVSVMYSKELLGQIDTIRGDMSRSAWLRSVAEEAAYRPKFSVTILPAPALSGMVWDEAWPVHTEDEVAEQFAAAESQLNAILSDGANGA